ncbi:hypothetical protein O1D97_03785 [Marinomonas sp. 15G1-11]|uniref:Uncharacterized protein n=1 Tax=Marinomonas phaeophyticola TaxID=3004091 RepID=A0ABT4JQY6_9GAMM|nr:hypothetical protein [Marinomonas sp. 15G1-11]MCZ2720785.1 hypothetical protein [Marinomonas sp. 15G1-11]
MVEQIHQDYIQYSQLNNDTSYLAASFILKWIVFACAAILFIITNIFFQSKKTSRQKPPASNTVKKSFIFRSTVDKKEPVTRLKDDPFDAIRHKPQLRSKADVMLEKSQKERN